MARDSTGGNRDSGDRTGEGKAGQLGKVIDGASRSSMNEVLDVWGPPPRKQEAPATALAEKPETQAEKKLLKGRIQQNERVEDPLNTDQIGMMALHGHPLAQAGAEMLKAPAAQNKEIRDGIKRDISSMLGDWFKEQFKNVTNVISGFDKWVQANLNAGKLKEAAEGIRRAAFVQHDGTAATASKSDGDMANFHLKGVESPQDVAEYGASTAEGAARTLDGLARGLTPRGFVEGTHAIAEAGRQAIKNAGEYYGERGIASLPADTADATDEAYDRLGQWSADRMQMEPGERGDVTGSAMAAAGLFLMGKRILSNEEAAKVMGVEESAVMGASEEQLAAKGLKRLLPSEYTGKTATGRLLQFSEESGIEVRVVKEGQDNLWKQTPFARGNDAHVALGENLPAGTKTIDRTDFRDGVAESIKSLDPTLPSYESPTAFESKLTDFVHKLEHYKGRQTKKGGGFQMREHEIDEKILHVTFPDGALSDAQMDVLEKVGKRVMQYNATKPFDKAPIRIKVTVLL